MLPSNLSIRHNTLDRPAKWIGGVGIAVYVLYFCTAGFFDPLFEKHLALIVGVLVAYITFLQVYVAMESKRRAELHAVEEFRPYLILVSSGEQVFVENVGRGLAIGATLYSNEKKITLSELGILRPQEKRPLESETAAIVKMHGAKIFCRCQFGRRWGSFISPMSRNFAVEFVEFHRPRKEEREF